MRKGYTWLLVDPDHPRHTQTDAAPSSSADSADSPEPARNSAGTEGGAEWLFVRGEESIRIVTDRATTTLLEFGPGPRQTSYRFGSAASLEKFRQTFEQRVLLNGWVLLDIADRRVSGRR
jgi:hypothetical protein